MVRLTKYARRLEASVLAGMAADEERQAGEQTVFMKLDKDRVGTAVEQLASEAPDTHGTIWREHYVAGASLTSIAQQIGAPVIRLRRMHEDFIYRLQQRLRPNAG